jgi:hypothetical protein
MCESPKYTPKMGFEIPRPEQALQARIHEFRASIKLMSDAGFVNSSLVLLYTAIDFVGSLLRPKNKPDTAGEYFKNWVDKYMIAGSKVPFTANDIWGARCGLLHTQTASSKVFREGKARQIHYYRGSLPPDLEHAMKSLSSKGKLFVNRDSFTGCFEQGIDRFLADVERNPALKQRVLQHAESFLGSWRSE